MNGIENRRTRNTDKPVPGCLGRVVNFFDLSTGVAGNRLLTDKQHFDGFGHSRRQPDAMRISPIGDELDEEVVSSGLTKSSSNRNINGTSVKMLIAEEMSKEVELEHNSPNLVAKLMGLDSLPQRKLDSVAKRSHSRSYSGSNIGMGLDSRQQEKVSPKYNRNKEFPDMTWQSRKGRNMREKPPCEASNEKKMDLVRQKFVEAKSLSTSEKLRQSKKYEEALEVLSSNRGLFLKLLEEPNTFSQNKRITVLRPSKIFDDNQIPRSGTMNAKPSKKELHMGQVNRLDKRNKFSPPSSRPNENPTQSTRIVVLKPSGKPRVSLPPSPPREHGEEMSSVFSNGYSGDESSFHKSENELNLGNLSDSEIVTPRSRHTWDYIHRFESPYGSSSFSHASCSPDSSVCREAKKRLSERWALMASNGNCQERRHLWKSSSTLGEMLSLSDTKKVVIPEEKGTIEEKETRESPLCSTSNLNIEQFANDSPRKLSRSNSVPASSTVAVDTLNRVLDAKAGEANICKETTMINTPKLSFKEKFSSLFFSRNKKTNKDKFPSSQSKYESEKPVTMLVQSPEKVGEGILKCSRVIDEEHPPENSIAQDHIGMERKHGVISPESTLCVTNPSAPRNLGKNQDQPSPVSVLEPPFEEDENITTDSSNLEGDKCGSELVARSVNSTPTNKSSAMESIARTLSWDDPCVETATSYPPLKPSRVSRGVGEKEQELLFFVKSLLSAAGFDDEVAPNSLFAKWHSPESPLDPSLRDSFVDMNAKDIKHEAKRMQRRLVGKLAFDCVNTALVEIVDYGLAKRCCVNTASKCSPFLLVDEVLTCVKEWFSCEVSDEFVGDDVDSSSLIVEAMVRKELVGTDIKAVLIESDNVGKDIEAILLEELVQEVVVDFSGRV